MEKQKPQLPLWERVFYAVTAFVLLSVLGFLVLGVFLRNEGHGTAKSWCLNNVRECANALSLYAEAYDNNLPSSVLVSGSRTWNKADSETFTTGAAAELAVQPGCKPKTWTQLLWPYMPTKDIWLCYKDPDKEKSNPRSSYWYKLALDKAWYGEGCKKPYRKVSDFAYPGSQVVLYEHYSWHGKGNYKGLKNGALINAAYLDGHAASVRVRNATSGDPMNCAANSDGEPMYFNYNEKTNGAFTDRAAPATWVDPGECSDHLDVDKGE